MTWKELFAKVGIKAADVIPIDPEMRYVVLCDTHEVGRDFVYALTDELKSMGVKAMVVLVHDADTAIRFMELKPGEIQP